MKYLPKIWKILKEISNEQLKVLSEGIGNPDRYAELTEVITSLWRDVLVNKCDMVDRYLKRVSRTKATRLDIDQFIERYLELFMWEKVVSPINDHMKEWIQEHYLHYMAQGLGYDQIVEKMQLDRTTKWMALRIVRTEGTRASGAADYLSASTVGFETKKKWLNVKDKRVRRGHSHHAGVGGEEAELNEEYSNGMMMPGDTTAPVEQVVNCRCTQRIIPKRDANGRLIRKTPLDGRQVAERLLTRNFLQL